MIILICESLARSDDDALSSMDSQRIKVLHVTNCDAVVRLVPHDFIFHLFPAGEILLHQDLRRVGQGLFYSLPKSSFIFASTRAQSSQSKRDSDHHWITYLSRSILGLFQTPGCLRTGSVDIDLLQPFDE